MKKLTGVLAILFGLSTMGCGQTGSKIKKDTNHYPGAKPAAEWRKTLTPNQYYIMVEKGTEYPYKNEYFENHEKGMYVSAATGEPLFNSDDKFESGTGWPSFTKPVNSSAVMVVRDADGQRDEVVERKTGLHLGHVFDDGPADKGGKRYCMNSAALKFVKKASK